MAQELKYSSERDATLGRLMERALEPQALEASLSLLPTAVAELLLPEEASPAERASLLGWLIRQLAASPAEEQWISEEARHALSKLAGIAPGSKANPATRRRAWARDLAPAHKETLSMRQVQRRRVVVVHEIADAIERAGSESTILGLLNSRWRRKDEAAGFKPKRGNFRTLKFSSAYVLGRDGFPKTYTEDRRLLPVGKNAEEFSVTAKYLLGNHLLTPSVSGAEYLYETGDELSSGQRRYFVRFDSLLSEGDPPVDFTVSYEISRGTARDPVRVVGFNSDVDTDLEVHIEVSFAKLPNARVYESYGVSTAYPEVQGKHSCKKIANHNGTTFTADKMGMHEGYLLTLTWPDVDFR